MYRNLVFFTVTLGVLCIILASGCSGANGDSASPLDSPIIQAPEKEAQSGRQLWGAWQFSFDESTNELTPIPLREAYAHFNVTPFLLPPDCDDCLKIKVNSFDTVTRILDADVTLRNPTEITGHDVRGILYGDDYGHELRNADDWTGLWNIPGGQNINPFKAFAKATDHHQFTHNSQFTVKYLVYIPVPPHYSDITYAVDASWPGNCKDPYSIENFTQETLYDTGEGQAMITIDVLDWQDDVNKVTLVAPAITGESFTQLYKISGNTWGIYLKNNVEAPAGNYNVRFIATSAGVGELDLYDYVTITITESLPAGWARTWGGSDYDRAYGVAVDGSGNAYVTGYFYGTADFDPGSGTDEHVSNGIEDICLSKFDSNGVFQWARTWGGADYERGYGVAVDGSGNIYVTGYFEGTVDFDPGVGTDEHTSNAYYDIFLSKFNANGDFQWARTWGGDSVDTAYGVAAHSPSDIYVVGYFKETVDFDPGGGTEEYTSDSSSEDVFLSKFDATGNFQWVRTWGGWAYDEACGVAADSLGNIFVTGDFARDVDFNPPQVPGEDVHWSEGPTADIFLSKFNSSGDYQWARTWGGSNWDEGYSVATDSSGYIYVTGDFNDTVDFDPGAGTDEHSATMFCDIFLSKFDTNGDFLWANTWGSDDDHDKGYGVAADVSSNVYVTGVFSETVDFNPGDGIDEVDDHVSNGGFDPFLSKFNSSGDFQWARTWGGVYDADYCRGVAVDGPGNIFVTGDFWWAVDFDPGTGTDNHTSNGDYDIFLSKFPPDGNW